MCTSQKRMPFILIQRTRCSVQPAYLLQLAGDPVFDALGLLLHLPGVQQSLHLLEQTMLWNIKPCSGKSNHVLNKPCRYRVTLGCFGVVAINTE